MRSMKLRKEVTGQNLHDVASRNLRKAVLRENESRQGSLSLLCQNHFLNKECLILCLDHLQISLRKSMA